MRRNNHLHCLSLKSTEAPPLWCVQLTDTALCYHSHVIWIMKWSLSLRGICRSNASPGASSITMWSICHLNLSFMGQFLLEGRVHEMLFLSNETLASFPAGHTILSFNPPPPAFMFFLFARLTWRGKTRPVGSLSTCAAWEKGTGLGRKHFKGKTACNNTAVFNLNPVLSCCLCHPPPIWLHLQHVFNIPTRTRALPFIVCTIYLTCPFDNTQLLSCTSHL